MAINLPWGNIAHENKSSCEHEVTLAPGQSLPQGSSLSRVHVNRPLETVSFADDMKQSHMFEKRQNFE